MHAMTIVAIPSTCAIGAVSATSGASIYGRWCDAIDTASTTTTAKPPKIIVNEP
jgi:hypothetical protein